MFAVIKAGGKHLRVAANDTITIAKTVGDAGDVVTFENVLMVAGEGQPQFGAPFVAGASVAAEIVEQTRGPKTINFKKRRRQNSKRKKGHRQDLTVVRITEILLNGAKAKAGSAPKKAAATNDAGKAAVAAAGATAAVGLMGAAAGKGESTRDTSNLSLISGIGPTIEKKLRAAGVQNWEQIAAWSDADLEKLDGELALRG
ncbi:MAG: 50S ribosomal protein L21, partial [Beijerinckiaceae bacterium]